MGVSEERRSKQTRRVTSAEMRDVTQILNAIQEGNARAADELLPAVYEELRLLAAQRLSQEKPGQTLQATALVHEAYIRLVGQEARDWKSRSHFFRAAAEAMRRILIDNARRKKGAKGGGRHNRIEYDAALIPDRADRSFDELLALNKALERLAENDRIRADLVKLRYFAGLTIAQTAEILGISEATAKRYWNYARAWLIREIG
ncbi:MAG: sigma-70 family RNA polymerase sigma factor [Sedimentisphaerales bacterium]|nr:sigma-70 family RNA polymerase sigma factor [Sedimentisphaerales bacterium]